MSRALFMPGLLPIHKHALPDMHYIQKSFIKWIRLCFTGRWFWKKNDFPSTDLPGFSHFPNLPLRDRRLQRTLYIDDYMWQFMYTECSLNIMFFPRNLESLPPLPRQHSAAIGCTKNYQPKGVIVHPQFVESIEGLLQQCRRGRGCSELWNKNIFIENHLCIFSRRLVNFLSWKLLWSFFYSRWYEIFYVTANYIDRRT